MIDGVLLLLIAWGFMIVFGVGLAVMVWRSPTRRREKHQIRRR